MIHVSLPTDVAPTEFDNATQRLIYTTLADLQIPFTRVSNDPAVTMDDCQAIDRALEVRTAKNILLTNRQQTAFYLLAMPADKPFVTRDFSRALGIARVSFAPGEALRELLGTERGATTLLSLVADPEYRIKAVIDSRLMEDEYIGCPDGTTTGYMRLRTADVAVRYLPFTGHIPVVVGL